MSQASQPQPRPRKRKQIQSTTSPSNPDAQQPVVKKSKHSSSRKEEKKKDKARGDRHRHESRRRKDDVRSGEFKVVSSTLVVSIPPLYASNPRQGLQEMLDGMLMRYVPALKGVVISHSNLQFLDRTSTIKADSPFAICRIAFDATIWSPEIGMKLLGKINLCSPDHISLLVHRVFNASIPRGHIQTDHWEFEYGPADNDPDFAPDVVNGSALQDTERVQGQDHKSGNTEPPTNGDAEGKDPSSGGGRWVHRITSEDIGGSTGYLEFTVIGLTMANQMLSVVGSIQPDPFSPRHVPALSTSPTRSQQDDEAEVLGELGIEVNTSASSDDEDAFARLGKMADEAKEAEIRVREEIAAAVPKERSKKKKRKQVEGNGNGNGELKKLKRKKP